MEAWREAWRRGFAPQFHSETLRGLLAALRSNSVQIGQDYTCYPWPNPSNYERACESACPVGYCGMVDGLETVGEVNEFFGEVCHNADRLLGGPGECRHFLNAVDSWSRPQLLANLIPEVELALQNREAA